MCSRWCCPKRAGSTGSPGWSARAGADALRRLAALLAADAAAAAALAERLHLSNAERDRLVVLAAPSGGRSRRRRARAAPRALSSGRRLYRDLVLLRAAEQGDTVRARPLLGARRRLAPAEFPLKGRDVTALGIADRAGDRPLARRQSRRGGRTGDFRADRDAALAELKQRAGKR